MARWREDDVDVACTIWAHQWVAAFGHAPDRGGRTIGPLNCTLGRVLERHDGAASGTEHARRWPEVFLGQGLVVALALHAMTLSSRQIIAAHYLWRWHDTVTWKRRSRPVKQRLVAHHLGLSAAEYYHRRDTAKSCIRVAMSIDAPELVRAQNDSRHESPCMRAG